MSTKEQLIEEIAINEANRVIMPVLDLFGGADGGISFSQLKTNLESLYAEYQRNPTHKLTQVLKKIEASFEVITKLSG